MRDISPNERAILERAARHVTVYERSKPDKVVDPTYGCFDCDHSVGAMGDQAIYATVGISALLPDQGHDGPFDLTLVISHNDRFWQSNRKDAFFMSTLGSLTRMPNFRMSYYMMYDLLGDDYGKSFYVRQYWTPWDGLKHINSRVKPYSLLNRDRWLDQGYQDDNVEMSLAYIPGGGSGGAYFDPADLRLDWEMNTVKWESLRVAPNVSSSMVRQYRKIFGESSGMNLKRITAKDEEKKKKKKKVGKVTWATTQAENLWDNVGTFTLDPAEQDYT